MGTPRQPEWLLQALRRPDPRLLFHGTIEQFEGRICASDWEGLRWFAESPEVAQAYCPESGSSILWSNPGHRGMERMIPDTHGASGKLFRMMGHDPDVLEIERDGQGRVMSFRAIEGHPTWNDAHRYVMQELGYAMDNGSCWLKLHKEHIMPAAWKKMGRLFILPRKPSLRIYDLRGETEGGLMGRQWMQTERFKQIEKQGVYDGVLIHDVHQSATLGHFEHDSIGLFDRTLCEMEWTSIPCMHRDPADFQREGRTTPEIEQLIRFAGLEVL